jgi:hypothetical protein
LLYVHSGQQGSATARDMPSFKCMLLQHMFTLGCAAGPKTAGDQLYSSSLAAGASAGRKNKTSCSCTGCIALRSTWHAQRHSIAGANAACQLWLWQAS